MDSRNGTFATPSLVGRRLKQLALGWSSPGRLEREKRRGDWSWRMRSRSDRQVEVRKKLEDPQVQEGTSAAALGVWKEPLHVASFIRLLGNVSLPLHNKQKLLLKAEATPMTKEQELLLLPLLRAFLHEHRDDPTQVTVVCSVIRQYIARLGGENFEQVEELLRSKPKAPSPKVKLEVSKMIVRRVVASPPEGSLSGGVLYEQLWHMSQAYLNDWLLSEEKINSAIALNVTLAVILLGDDKKDELLGALGRLSTKDFSRVVTRRALRLWQQIPQGDESRVLVKQRLEALIPEQARS